MCPDSLIEHVFRPTQQSTENMPLIHDRIRIMREVGFILCNVSAFHYLGFLFTCDNHIKIQSFGGSFKGFIDEFHIRHHGQGSALDLVKMVIDTFPSFRDQVWYQGRTGENTQSASLVMLICAFLSQVYFWKRAQILVAELWAAFYPETPSTPHPLFPGPLGPRIHELTMFADYRVPQILHHLRILNYPPSLMRLLKSGADLIPGCREEVSLRASSIIAIERVRHEIVRSLSSSGRDQGQSEKVETVSSVLIDFYLWDLAKRIENGEERVEGIETAELAPIHHTRSIWY